MRSGLRLCMLLALAAGTVAATGGPVLRDQCVQVAGVNDRCPEWSATYDNPPGGGGVVGADRAVASALSPDGSLVFVTGTSSDDDTGGDIVTLAFDAATGTRLWVVRHHVEGLGREEPRAITVSPDGSTVFVAGAEDLGLETAGTPSEDSRFVTLAYDAGDGGLRWRATIDGGGGGDDIASAIGVAPDGSAVYVAGSTSGSSGVDLTTVAYAPGTGAEIWRARTPGVAPDLRRLDAQLAVAPGGSRVFVATSEGAGTSGQGGDLTVIALEARDPNTLGEQRWATRIDGGDEERTRALAAGGDGVYLAASRGADWVTLSLDPADGEPRWENVISRTGLGRAVPAGLGVSASGDRLFVTGTALQETLAVDPLFLNADGPLTLAYDTATGSEVWSTSAGDSPFHDQARAIAVAAGTIYVTTETSPARGGGGSCSIGQTASCTVVDEASHASLLAYNASDGLLRWTARLEADPLLPTTAGSALSAGGGRIFLAGYRQAVAASSPPAEAANFADLLVAAYDG